MIGRDGQGAAQGDRLGRRQGRDELGRAPVAMQTVAEASQRRVRKKAREVSRRWGCTTREDRCSG